MDIGSRVDRLIEAVEACRDGGGGGGSVVDRDAMIRCHRVLEIELTVATPLETVVVAGPPKTGPPAAPPATPPVTPPATPPPPAPGTPCTPGVTTETAGAMRPAEIAARTAELEELVIRLSRTVSDHTDRLADTEENRRLWEPASIERLHERLIGVDTALLNSANAINKVTVLAD